MPWVDVEEQPKGHWEDVPDKGFDLSAGEPWPGAGEQVGAFHSFAKGVTFNWANELGAAELSSLLAIKNLAQGKPMGFKQNYDVLTKAVKERQAAFAEKNPATSLGLEIGGSIPTAILSGPAAAALAPAKVVQMASRLPGWMKATGVGAGVGSVAGAGEDEENRLGGAGLGALTGGAVGTALYPVIRSGQMALGAGGKLIQKYRDPSGAAQRELAEAANLDELSPNKLGQQLRDLGPQATIADAGGENIGELARKAASVPGAPRNIAMGALEKRSAGEVGRIETGLKKLDPREYFATEDKIVERLKTRAGPWYERAFKKYQHIEDNEVNSVLTAPDGKVALKRAARTMLNDKTLPGKIDPELTAALKEAAELDKADDVMGGVARGLKLRTLNYVKIELDQMATAAETKGEMNDARIFGGLARSLVSALDKATGGANSPYAKARAIWGGDKQIKDALNEGRDFAKLHPQEIKRLLPTLSEGAQDAYRAGAVQGMKDIIEKAPDTTSASARIFGNPGMRGRLNAIFPDPGSYNDVSKLLAAEMRFRQTEKRVLGGALRKGEAGPAGEILGTAGAVIGSQIPAAGGLVQSGVQAGFLRHIGTALAGSNEPVNKALSKMLLNRNQVANQKIIDDIAKQDPEKAKALSATYARILGMMGSQQAGTAAGNPR